MTLSASSIETMRLELGRFVAIKLHHSGGVRTIVNAHKFTFSEAAQ